MCGTSPWTALYGRSCVAFYRAREEEPSRRLSVWARLPRAHHLPRALLGGMPTFRRLMYGKATETAIAAMSRLAEIHNAGGPRVPAGDIADNRKLQRPFVAKVLTTLSQAGLVVGSRGPGGGFALARPPEEIKLYDVYRLFEREDVGDVCPFGGEVCGSGDPCALHDKLVRVKDAVDDLLHQTTFAEFHERERVPPVVDGSADDSSDGSATPSGDKPRESFRASLDRG